jgi:hypothetical protein
MLWKNTNSLKPNMWRARVIWIMNNYITIGGSKVVWTVQWFVILVRACAPSEVIGAVAVPTCVALQVNCNYSINKWISHMKSVLLPYIWTIYGYIPPSMLDVHTKEMENCIIKIQYFIKKNACCRYKCFREIR